MSTQNILELNMSLMSTAELKHLREAVKNIPCYETTTRQTYNLLLATNEELLKRGKINKRKEYIIGVGDAITGEGELSHYVEYENNQI